MKIGIIGAGPAGLTAAYQLAKAGLSVTVFEASAEVGGLARTIELWGQRVDIGPHRFFSSDARVNKLWLEVVGADYLMVSRLTRIFYEGRFFNYPLTPINALWNMGLLRAVRCLGSYWAEKLRGSIKSDTRRDFESWVVSRFGRRLFEMFFESYSEKLWGIDCKELDSDFATQRIKKFSLGQAVFSALGLGKGKHKTLVDEFAYPLEGTGMVYERMASAVRDRGGEVRLSSPIKRVVTSNHKVTGIELQNGTMEPFDHVISTMPLTELVRRLDDAPGEVGEAVASLTYRSTIIVYLHVKARHLFADQWLYIHSPSLKFGRLTNFRNWVPGLYRDKETTILALEYWCNKDDATWCLEDQELVRLGQDEVVATGLVKRDQLIDGKVLRISRSYPVYKSGYKDALAKIIAFVDGVEGLAPIGRYGSFKYNNQDHSILMGMLAAENVVTNSSHDLWGVNSDYETYQESALITATGLTSVKG